MKNWSELIKLTQAQPITIERVRLQDGETVIEGSFELPPLARLTLDEQVFVGSFLRTHGSIKEMERLFGVSYPTIKNRLNQISEKLGFLNIETSSPEKPSATHILEKLNAGLINPTEALEALKTANTLKTNNIGDSRK